MSLAQLNIRDVTGKGDVGNKIFKILRETLSKMRFYGSTTLSTLLISW
jgi:hypothetical protein